MLTTHRLTKADGQCYIFSQHVAKSGLSVIEFITLNDTSGGFTHWQPRLQCHPCQCLLRCHPRAQPEHRSRQTSHIGRRRHYRKTSRRDLPDPPSAQSSVNVGMQKEGAEQIVVIRGTSFYKDSEQDQAPGSSFTEQHRSRVT